MNSSSLIPPASRDTAKPEERPAPKDGRAEDEDASDESALEAGDPIRPPKEEPREPEAKPEPVKRPAPLAPERALALVALPIAPVPKFPVVPAVPAVAVPPKVEFRP